MQTNRPADGRADPRELSLHERRLQICNEVGTNKKMGQPPHDLRAAADGARRPGGPERDGKRAVRGVAGVDAGDGGVVIFLIEMDPEIVRVAPASAARSFRYAMLRRSPGSSTATGSAAPVPAPAPVVRVRLETTAAFLDSLNGKRQRFPGRMPQKTPNASHGCAGVTNSRAEARPCTGGSDAISPCAKLGPCFLTLAIPWPFTSRESCHAPSWATMLHLPRPGVQRGNAGSFTSRVSPFSRSRAHLP